MSAETQIEYKHVAFELKAEPDDAGVFEGYASVFDVVDQGMDIVKPGAFADSLKTGRRVAMLWQQNSDKPIGVWDEVREDERGLFVRGRLATQVQQAQEARELLKMGALNGMSIGYRVKEAAGERIRELTAVDLFEVSLVTFPMLPVATVTAVKSIGSKREFERALRDAGFTKSEALAITAKGFAGFADVRREAVADDEGPNDGAVDAAPFLDAIRRLQEQFNAGV